MPGWVFPVAAVVVALAFGVNVLHGTLEGDNEARLRLARLAEDALEQQVARREVSEERRDLGESLARLDDGGRSASIRQALGDAGAAFDEELRPIRAGRSGEAASSETRTHPAFVRLDGLLDEAGAGYEGAVARAERLAGLGAYTAILLSAAALVVLFRRYQKARRAAQREIEESKQRYELAYRGANDGLWDWDLRTGEVHFSARWKEILGYADHEFPGRYEEWEERVHSQDLPGIRAALSAHLEGETPYYEVEYRLRHRDGRYRWVLARGASVRDGDGTPYRMAGSHTEVTERREAEEKLQESRRGLADAQRISHVGNWSYDILADEASWSDELFRIFGLEPGEISPRYGTFLRFVHPNDKGIVRGAVREALYGEPPPEIGFRVARPSGEDRDVRARYEVIHDADGKPSRIVGTVQDVTERKATEEELSRLASFPELNPNPIVEADLGGVTYANPAALRLFPELPEAGLCHPLLAGLGPLFGEIRGEGGGVRTDEVAVGDAFYHLTVSCLSGGGRVRVYAMDTTERRKAEEKLKVAEERYRTLIEQIPVVTYVREMSHDRATLYISPQLYDLVGCTAEEYVSDPDLWASILHPEDRDRVMAEDERTEETGEPFRMEYRMISRDGRVVWVRDEAAIVRDARGEPLHWRGVMLDITESKTLENRLAHQAFHDPLTGLPNRALLADRLAHALARLERRGESPETDGSVAVLMVDLDNFKAINDSLGHEAGDELLVAVAGRLRGSVRPADTVARLGGDEFTVLLEDLRGAGEAARVAERALAAFAAPFAVGGQEVLVTTSIGIALGGSTLDGGPEDLLRAADIAMYGAKRKGKAGYGIFDPSLGAEAHARLALENDLRRAVGNGCAEFRLAYQPEVLLETGRPVGFEALLRWQHPERGLVAPDEFVGLAEETGLLVGVSRWVLGEACRRAREWRSLVSSKEPMTVGVNLSAKQFGDPGLVEGVRAALAESGLEPGGLVLEVAESAVMDDAPAASETLAALASLGVGLAIDDFGTGYSSLSYLQSFPVDYLKIDRSFVDGIGEPEADAVVRAMTDLAGTLGLRVIAEGVESEEQRAKLEDLGCELAQGYLFSKPLPAPEVSRLLADRLGPVA